MADPNTLRRVAGAIPGRAYMLAYKHDCSIQTLLDCQDEVHRLGNHPHIPTYHRDEMLSWFHLPRWISEDTASHATGTALDLDCGRGVLAAFCREALGSEVYCACRGRRELSGRAEEKYGLQVAEYYFESEECPWDVAFDIVMMPGLLGQLEAHPVDMLTGISKLLADAGRMYLSAPVARRAERAGKGEDAGLRPEDGGPAWTVHEFSKDELLSVVDSAGLAVERFGYAPGCLQKHFNMALSCQEHARL